MRGARGVGVLGSYFFASWAPTTYFDGGYIDATHAIASKPVFVGKFGAR